MEPQADIAAILSAQWKSILVVGLVLLGVGKVIWYEGLKRLDISKAISLGMTSPVVSLAVLALFFHEYPTLLQWVGIMVMAAGVAVSIKRSSVLPARTKYSPYAQ